MEKWYEMVALSKDIQGFMWTLILPEQKDTIQWIPVLLWGGLLYAVIFESFNETFHGLIGITIQ